jgi:FKBP-type peptidyl-prolyl cis-trans isomerase FklB
VKLLTTSLLTLALSAGVIAPAVAADAPKTDEEKFGYAIGFQIGQNLKGQGLTDLDVKAMAQAIEDVLNDRKLKLSMDEMQQAFQAAQQKMMAEREAQGKEAKDKGEKFLAENKKKAGVTELKSGIQYKVIKEGNGESPSIDDTVVAHYRGTLIDGTVFDSSYKRGEPATFPLSNVIQGWQEILPLMKVGSKWEVFIPSEMAYGAKGAGANIGPNETLIFEIELKDIKEGGGKAPQGQ